MIASVLSPKNIKMSETKIRRATIEDISTIVDFNEAMALETEGKILESPILSSGVNAVFQDPKNGFYIVCELDQTVRASLMITYEWSDWRNGMYLWIQSVFVDKEYRQQGLYTIMYDYVKNLVVKESKFVGVRLYVDEENLNAQEVYTRLGMKKSNYHLFEYTKPK